ncbi:hypothetical protein EN41_27125 [Agrobacterium tumefaciens]|uniref:Uncharacterized protein n=1 Tax=Agrobacterium fabrum (strain C58 / ATCC 33970) TaxID=176299 RepID=A9CLS4_AGRFC|nr:hypothetical protein [Agrobacterium fabrum]KEY52882.1 hypothetical protein EN41_27125 [Agrobacterium tumefaciens]AAK90407.1 hypothetical protein Atu5032 [Agrobacterium fabrum str. C58]KJX90421.1 hypothetical protein SY94_5008 [Agrobacterium tumefaciens]MCX2875259.1 hypothetical protein [Agrobacterium fabrum]NMV70835.1 hypothetical protein [Agrobacterium fabrum]
MSDNTNSYGHVVGRKATIIGAVILIALILIVLRVVQLDTLQDICGDDGYSGILLKRLTDCAGLSTLGDFLAGVFAPLAFIGLAATYFLQREQLRLAIEDSRKNEEARLKEAALNYASIQTNHKIALYDKRKLVFDRLMAAGEELMANVTDDTLVNLKLAFYDAQFVYPDDVQEWILSLLETSFRLRMQLGFIAQNEPKRNRQSWSNQDENALLEAYDEETKCRVTLYENLRETPLYERFKSYLKLPDSIKVYG